MPYDAVVYRIFLAAPSDTPDERVALLEFVRDWNAANSFLRRIVLEVVDWRTNVVPDYGGSRPQDVINRQLVQDCDLLIATFWTRLGTPSGVAPSGTAEEINLFENCGKRVMVYFSTREIRPHELDLEEFKRLFAFKAVCEEKGICSNYSDIPDFRGQLHKHISKWVNELLTERGQPRVEERDVARMTALKFDSAVTSSSLISSPSARDQPLSRKSDGSRIIWLPRHLRKEQQL